MLKIPELAKGIGQGMKDFKKAIKEDEEVKTTVDQVKQNLNLLLQQQQHTQMKKNLYKVMY